MGNAAPVFLGCNELTSGLAINGHEPLGGNIPKPESHTKAAVSQDFGFPHNEVVGVDDPPVSEAGLEVDIEIALNVCLIIDNRDQTRVGEIGP